MIHGYEVYEENRTRMESTRLDFLEQLNKQTSSVEDFVMINCEPHGNAQVRNKSTVAAGRLRSFRFVRSFKRRNVAGRICQAGRKMGRRWCKPRWRPTIVTENTSTAPRGNRLTSDEFEISSIGKFAKFPWTLPFALELFLSQSLQHHFLPLLWNM